MTFCVYDNPTTWRREHWHDGEKVASFSAHLIMAKIRPVGQSVPRPWNPGHVEGDAGAMKEVQPPVAPEVGEG